MAEIKKVKEPLFQISKRGEASLLRNIIVRVIAVISGILVGGLLCLIVYGKSPIDFVKYLFEGNFKPATRIWELFKGTALLLGVGLALIPAFKMKFWNLGGNGQVLIGALVSTGCLFYLGGKIPDGVLWVIMFVLSLLAGAIWAVIPAIFKAFFKTNESLFTLMMNYIATGLVAFAIKEWGGVNSSGTLNPINEGALPVFFNNNAILPIIVVVLMAVFVTVYMKFSKHGYEIGVVGDSENTARYVGINVKKVIIRTLAISGAMCGIVGFLIAGGLDHSVTTDSAKNMGFTAIIAVWVANMDPLMTTCSTLGIIFLTNGLSRVQQNFGITNDSVSNMIVGLMYLFIIACVFFTTYKVKINFKGKKAKAQQSQTLTNNQVEADQVQGVEDENKDTEKRGE